MVSKALTGPADVPEDYPVAGHAGLALKSVVLLFSLLDTTVASEIFSKVLRICGWVNLNYKF